MHEELGTAPGFYYLQDKRLASNPVPVVGEGIEPRHQKHWDWKAAANFLFGGSGSALFAFSVAFQSQALAAAGLCLVALGLGILLFKIGRPLRFLNVLRQPQRSWMSREAWIAAAFFPLGGLYVVTQSMVFGLPAAAAGLAFLFAQAMILKESKGIPAWRTPRIVPLIVLTNLAEGAALLSLAFPLPYVLAVLVALRGWAWFAYSRALERDGAPARTLEVLKAWRPWMFWAGLVLPLVLIVVPQFAGLAVVLSGWALKFILVTRAAYQQGFALKRGEATIKPGWVTGENAL
jgi:phenylacetyl-CoA:acceptor oxidoreductase subunit 2